MMMRFVARMAAGAKMIDPAVRFLDVVPLS